MGHHACRFEGCRLIARASRPLAAGEPALISYGPQVGASPTAVRRTLLHRQYHFLCGCAACAQPTSQQLASEAQRAALACPSKEGGCDGACLPCEPGLAQLCMPPGEGLGPQLELQLLIGQFEGQNLGGRPRSVCNKGVAEVSPCDKCGARLSAEAVAKARQLLGSAAAAYDQAATVMQALDEAAGVGVPAGGPEGVTTEAGRAAEMFARAAALQAQVLHVHNTCLGQTYHAAGTAACRAAEAAGAGPGAQKLGALAVEMLHKSVSLLQHHFPARSPQIAHEQLALAAALRLESGSDASQEAAAIEVEARQALALHFGGTGDESSEEECHLDLPD